MTARLSPAMLSAFVLFVTWCFHVEFVAVAADVPRDWIDAATGHRVIRLSDDSGGTSLYFHQNTYTPEGDKLIFDTPAGIVAVDISKLEVAPPKAELIVPDCRAIATARKTREVYFRRGSGRNLDGHLYAGNIDSGMTRIVKENVRAYDANFAVNCNETVVVTKTNLADPPIPRPDVRKLLPQRQRMFGDKLKQGIPLTPEEQVSARKEDGLARRVADPLCEAFIFTHLGIDAIIAGPQYAWLNHLQFSPTDPTLLLYCHEGTWHEVDRIWTIRTDGSQQQLMHERTMDMEIAGHEFWSHDGKMIWFDLQTPRSKEFWLAGMNIETGEETRYKIERDQWSVHYNVSRDGKLFAGDGGDPGQVAFAKNGQWIYVFRPQPDGTLAWERLVDMSRHNYRLEPNVTITPDSKWVVFRSNMHGPSHVYAARIAKE